MAQAIVTKFFGATNSKGARIQVKSWLGTKYYSYDYAAYSPHTEAFKQWLEETNKRLGLDFKWTTNEAASMPDDTGYVFIVE